ncbi:MAG TPA: hypothetical protein VFF18_00200 [Woeseiaceae bacterium]|nr:hypothetical protein [Woeseiaceae bacterium]
MPRMLPASRLVMFAFVLAALVAACSRETPSAPPSGAGYVRAAVAGTLQSPAIVEASGLAHSRRRQNLLWVINDGGEEPLLHAVTPEGEALGAVRVAGAENRDWEDLAAFSYEGSSWLLVADIGDNGGIRDHLTLYVVPEPEPADGEVAPAWTVRYTYPDGPHDAEAVAVDGEAGHIYVLTKRTEPAELHTLPLRPAASAGVLISTLVTGLDSLPAREEAAGLLAAAVPYHWQPTGMDMAADGSAVAVLTYADVYYYPRRQAETWADALAREPLPLGMPLVPIAEAVAFDERGRSLFITAEGRHAPLLRFDPEPQAD